MRFVLVAMRRIVEALLYDACSAFVLGSSTVGGLA
jgi:hypothetical protein